MMLCVIGAVLTMSGCLDSADTPTPPLTITADIDPTEVGSYGDPYVFTLDVRADETATMQTIGTEYDRPSQCTYDVLADTDDSVIYSFEHDVRAGGQLIATLRDDHTATIEAYGYTMDGVWK